MIDRGTEHKRVASIISDVELRRQQQQRERKANGHKLDCICRTCFEQWLDLLDAARVIKPFVEEHPEFYATEGLASLRVDP